MNDLSKNKVHAKLGASSAKRWINCPGSLQFISSLPDHLLDDSSEFAIEGTEAHELAEELLISGADVDNINENEAVQIYLNEVRSLDDGFTETFIEEKFKLNEEMFGTNDAVVVDLFHGHITVFDYKHGVGVPVEVEENEQLMYYALGALKRFDPNRKLIQKVTLCIVQPRAFHEKGPIRKWEVTAERIYIFETVLLLAAAATKVKDASLISGSHCRFCPAVAVCPTYKKAIVSGLNNPALAEALKTAEALGSWKAAIKRVVFKSLSSGKPVKGFKLVEMKKHRIWIDPKAVSLLLNKKEECFDYKLKSPAQVEKIVGEDWVGVHSRRPTGDLVVALESDKRKAWSKASHAFADEP